MYKGYNYDFYKSRSLIWSQHYKKQKSLSHDSNLIISIFSTTHDKYNIQISVYADNNYDTSTHNSKI